MQRGGNSNYRGNANGVGGVGGGGGNVAAGAVGGGGGGGNKRVRKTGPYHQIITAADLDAYPICWGNISVATVNGTPHAHATCDFVDGNCRGDLISPVQLLIPGDEDPQRWIKVVDQCVADKLIPANKRDAYVARTPEVAKDVRLINEMSALVLLPGEKPGFSLKSYVGLPGKNGQLPELTLHHRIERAKLLRLREIVAEFLDANPEFKRKLLSDGLKDKSKLRGLLEIPTIDLIVSPVEQSKYKEDVKDPNTGVILHEAGDHIVSDPDIVSYRPTISFLDNGGDKSTTPGAGCFGFNYRDSSDDTYMNAIWWSPTIVPVQDEQGRTVGQKCIEHILEEREWMYCSKANLPKDYMMGVGEKPFFTIRGNILKYGLPMLHSSEGKIKLTFFYKKAMFLGKNNKSGDDALGKSIANMNMAALMSEYNEEEEEEEEKEGEQQQQEGGDNEAGFYEGEIPYEPPHVGDTGLNTNVDGEDGRSGGVKRKNPFETKPGAGASDDDVVFGNDEGSEDSEHAIVQKKKVTPAPSSSKKPSNSKHQDKKARK